MSTTAVTIPNPLPANIVAISETAALQIAAAIEIAQKITAVDASNLAAADTAYSGLKNLEKGLEKDRTAMKAPVLEIGRSIDAAAKKASEPLVAEKDRIGLLIYTFQKSEQERAERERKEAEEKARQERERAEEQERLRQIELKKNTTEAAQISAELGHNFTPDPVKTPAYVPQTVTFTRTAPPKSAAISIRKVKVLVIDNEAQIPLEISGVRLWQLDHAAIERLLKAGATVPGAHLEEQDQIAGKR